MYDEHDVFTATSNFPDAGPGLLSQGLPQNAAISPSSELNSLAQKHLSPEAYIMVALLAGFDANLYNQHFCPQGHSIATQVPLLEKTLRYPGFNPLDPYLHGLAWSTPSAEFWHGWKTALRSFQQQSSEFLTQMSQLIIASRSAINQLHSDAPALSSEWTKCYDALTNYLVEVEKLQPSHSSVAATRWCDTTWETVPQYSEASPATVANLALSGWVYFGQLESFSVYIRVFIKLLQLGARAWGMF